ncbi:putative NAD-dependent protein deacetylase, SIR2 family [Erwinia phage KEY]|uniref:NAD-dependent protein deacetylase, SIR2 family n=1 Tax=Erwinia phage KEY TaxID=2821255 RepID=A0AAE7WAY4_9CAUD|nr:putative NAD-dependent protein deacetylase, SIR2 family [Erwinia phage KEY]
MRRLIVISGAGLSVESGVRAFRADTASGKAMWDEYDLEEVCNIHAFRGNFYHKTHMFYNKRRVELGTVEPNLAHMRIAEWYKRFPGQVANLTTNVDDLLERAGVLEPSIIHLHGYLPEIVIETEAGSPKEIVNVGYTEIDPDDYGWCKPNVVFFGEMAPKYMDMYNLLDTLTANDMVIVVGCSNQVINFNWELFPKVRRGTKMVVVNPAVPYHEMEIYQDNGILVYRAGAVETFGNKHFINMVEKFLEG